MPTPETSAGQDRRLRRRWDRQVDSYDRFVTWAERRLFRDTRAWVGGQAAGNVLEVAIGTGLNLPHYPSGSTVTGVDWSAGMLARADRRAAALGRPARLQVGDARRLPYTAESFDTVVATFVLCAVPDDEDVLTEMARVLTPGGRLLLVDHVAAPIAPGRALQALGEAVTVPLAGEHLRRRPVLRLPALGLEVERQERLAAGLIERVRARKP